MLFQVVIVVVDIKQLGCRTYVQDFNSVFELGILLVIATTLFFAEQVIIRAE